MMKYDTSKTLNENKKVIFEQSYVDPAAVGSAAVLGGVGTYAGAIAGAAYGATAGSMVFPVVGTAIGALAGLGLGGNRRSR
jgi:phage tail tape-measure protein